MRTERRESKMGRKFVEDVRRERGLGFGGKIFQAWGLGRRQLGRGRGCW